MTVLSIQSHVVSGHVGHQAGLLPLQRLGFDVLAIPSVLYSNHPGHGTFSGAPKGAGDLLAAVFMARCLKHENLSSALSQAVTVTHRILELSIRAGAQDLLIVAGQDHVINPGNRIAVTRVR